MEKTVRALLLVALSFSLGSCGYHFSENKGTKPGDGGFQGKQSELQKLENLFIQANEEALSELKAKVTAENVNAPLSHPEYGEGVTIVMIGATYFVAGALPMIQYLVEIGADTSVSDASGKYAFGYATAAAKKIAAEVNEQRKIDGKPIIEYQDVSGFKEVLKALEGPDSQESIDQKLVEAILNTPDNEAAKVLPEHLAAGADLNHLDPISGQTPFQLSLDNLKVGAATFLLARAKDGLIEVNARSKDGETVLGVAERLVKTLDPKKERRLIRRLKGLFIKELKKLGAVE